MKKIYAITGGIGAGKSTATNVIKQLGYTVFSADDVYADLIKNANFSREIYSILGLTYNEEKGFSRSEVSAVVFNNPTLLKKLNTFTHEKVINELMRRSENVNGLVFHEVPLLFENGFETRYNGVIVIYRNLCDRINSVVLRSGLTAEEVENRIKNQFDYENNSLNGHTVIVNDGVYENFKREVIAVVNELESKI